MHNRTSLPSPGRHDVHLVGVVGVEISHNVARVHGVNIQVVVIVVVVVDVIVDIDDEGQDPGGECGKVHGLAPGYDGGRGGAGTRLHLGCKPLYQARESRLSSDSSFSSEKVDV